MLDSKPEIVELPGIWMDSGAPEPMLLEGPWTLYLIFIGYAPKAKEPTLETEVIYSIRFHRVIAYQFGSPNDEVLHGHPYYKLGLNRYGFFEVLNSDWIKNLMKINSVHDHFNKENWKNARHFIITFKDDTFECVCNDYEIQYEKTEFKQKAMEIFNKIIEERGLTS